MKTYLLNRLAEASTWRGFVYLLTALGLSLGASQAEAIITAGLALSGVIGVFVADKKDQ
jgi:hypothetical protein